MDTAPPQYGVRKRDRDRGETETERQRRDRDRETVADREYQAKIKTVMSL